MKRFLVILFVTAILVGNAFANGKKEAAGSAAMSNAPTTITVWDWDPNFNGYAIKEAAAVYAKIHPNVTIDNVDIPTGIESKIEAGLQAGGQGLPDIALFQDFQIERFVKNYPGAFVDLKAAGVDYSQFAQYKVGPMTDGNKVYGIPFDTGSTGLWLRADMLKAIGLNPADYQKDMTWPEVIKLAETVKAKGGKPMFAVDTTNIDLFRIMVQSTGTQLFKADGSLDLNTPAVKQALTYIKQMNDEGLLYKAEGWNNWIAAFNNGDASGFVQALWIIGTLKTKPENAGKWMVVPTPSMVGIDGARNASNNGGSSWYVFSSSKNKATAVDFLKQTWATNTPAVNEFYNTILKGAGAMGTFLPSRNGSNYTAPDSYFYQSQPVYESFAKWMSQVPTLNYTPGYPAMVNSVRDAIQQMFAGKYTTVEQTIAGATQAYNQVTGN
ncbi:MAG TPA: ABC transporter substrate-binding protein [Spirochaetia bacterium]|nr:ABC transporter substrate-binding protein [Spirochaetia bacterium]